LVTVGDVHGLSYYSDAAIGRHLNLDAAALAAARQQLLQADLIAYHKPLYQVLALPEEDHGANAPAARTGQLRSIGEILRRAIEGGAA
jgi:hypothetical protein